MSVIRVEDPHPGRCKNHRPVDDAYGYPTHVRCLDYEGTEHVCRFPAITNLPPATTYTSASLPQPKPWVRPDNAGFTT